MITISGIDINIILLSLMGLGTGVLSGFAGVGGFIVTPLLIILGFPSHLAVGTSLTWVAGNSIIGAFRHRKLGNLDIKLGIVMVLAVMGGVEVGVRTLNSVRDTSSADETVLSVSICILLTVGLYTLIESIKRKRYLDKILAKGGVIPAMRATALSQKLQSINIPPMLHFASSEVTISLWIILALGFIIGLIVGIIGVGGGFIMVPALVYLLGIPSFMAVGTVLFQIIFSAAYGSIRHAMSGNVVIFASLIILIGSGFGIQFGALVTRYIRGVSARFILAISILITAIGTILKFLVTIIGKSAAGLEAVSLVVTFSGLGLAVAIISTLFIMAIHYRRDKHVPTWIESLVTKQD